MIRRKRDLDTGIDTYYNIDNEEIIIGGSLFGEIALNAFSKMGKLALKERFKHSIKSDFVKQRIKHGINEYVDKGVDDFTNNLANKFGSGIDIYKAILKIAPKKGFVLPGHFYTGPGNPLNNQVKWDSNGNILEIYQQPTGKTDAVSMQHDVDYSVCKNDVKCKNKADKKMVKSLHSIPYKQRQRGHALARNTIATKAKIGVGMKTRKLKSKNGKSQR